MHLGLVGGFESSINASGGATGTSEAETALNAFSTLRQMHVGVLQTKTKRLQDDFRVHLSSGLGQMR